MLSRFVRRSWRRAQHLPQLHFFQVHLNGKAQLARIARLHLPNCLRFPGLPINTPIWEFRSLMDPIKLIWILLSMQTASASMAPLMIRHLNSVSPSLRLRSTFLATCKCNCLIKRHSFTPARFSVRAGSAIFVGSSPCSHSIRSTSSMAACSSTTSFGPPIPAPGALTLLALGFICADAGDRTA